MFLANLAGCHPKTLEAMRFNLLKTQKQKNSLALATPDEKTASALFEP